MTGAIRTRRSNRGFTLIELMVTLAVIGILVVTATPSFEQYIANQRVKTGAQEIFTSLLYARSEAIKRNGNIYLYPNDAGDWEDGWIITTVDGKSYTQCTGDPTGCLKIQPATSGVDVSAGPASVIYDRNGRVAAAASFSVCDVAGAAGVRRRQVSTDLTGRPNIAYNGGCP